MQFESLPPELRDIRVVVVVAVFQWYHAAIDVGYNTRRVWRIVSRSIYNGTIEQLPVGLCGRTLDDLVSVREQRSSQSYQTHHGATLVWRSRMSPIDRKQQLPGGLCRGRLVDLHGVVWWRDANSRDSDTSRVRRSRVPDVNAGMQYSSMPSALRRKLVGMVGMLIDLWGR